MSDKALEQAYDDWNERPDPAAATLRDAFFAGVVAQRLLYRKDQQMTEDASDDKPATTHRTNTRRAADDARKPEGRTERLRAVLRVCEKATERAPGEPTYDPRIGKLAVAVAELACVLLSEQPATEPMPMDAAPDADSASPVIYPGDEIAGGIADQFMAEMRGHRWQEDSNNTTCWTMLYKAICHALRDARQQGALSMRERCVEVAVEQWHSPSLTLQMRNAIASAIRGLEPE